MKPVRILLLVMAVWLSPLSGIAAEDAGTGDVLRLSLAQVQDYAVKHSIATRNARTDVAMAKKKIWETTATGLPQINGEISYQNNLKLPTTLIPAIFFDEDAEEGEFIGVKFGTQHNVTASVTLSQLVFSGSYIVALQASKVYLKISQNQLVKSEIGAKEAVTKTYYLILLAQSNQKTLTANLENLKKTLFETKEMYKAGFLEDTDADQLQLSVTQLEDAVRSIKRQIAITYNLLKFQMGIDLDREVELTQSVEDILAGIDGSGLMKAQFDLNAHIDFKMADNSERSMRLLWKREKTEYLPTITAFFDYRQMAMRDSFNIFNKGEQWFPATTVGLNITIPVFSFGMRAAKVAQAKMELRKARNLKQQVSDGLKLEVLQARSAFADALDKRGSTGANLKLAEKIYSKTMEKYRQGMVGSLELTQIHNQYLTADSNHIQALVDLLNAKIRLDKALSRL